MGMSAKQVVRVVVIDDSITMRTLYRTMLAGCADIVLAGEAEDGSSGIKLVQELRPDLVLLDVTMPGMNGLDVLSRLHAISPRLPVMMCSTLTQRGAAVTLDALFRGAADYVAKPIAQGAPGVVQDEFRALLLSRIRALCTRLPLELPVAIDPVRSMVLEAAQPLQPIAPGVVVIGASTGGPQALEVVLSAIPADFSVPILIAQHIPPLFVPLLAERLQKQCPLRVREAVEGVSLCEGNVWIARGDWHLRIQASEADAPSQEHPRAVMHMEQDAPIRYCRPSVDALFISAARTFGAATLAVVLTGMGSDATDGARIVRAAGGTVLAQDAKTSTIWGMPGSVVQAGLANAVLPLGWIATELVYRAGRLHKQGASFSDTPCKDAVRVP